MHIHPQLRSALVTGFIIGALSALSFVAVCIVVFELFRK